MECIHETPLEVKWTEQQGRYVVATRDISAGEIILSTPSPYAFGVHESFRKRFCHCCVRRTTLYFSVHCERCNQVWYCSNECREHDRANGHELVECGALKSIMSSKLPKDELATIRLVIRALRREARERRDAEGGPVVETCPFSNVPLPPPPPRVPPVRDGTEAEEGEPAETCGKADEAACSKESTCETALREGVAVKAEPRSPDGCDSSPEGEAAPSRECARGVAQKSAPLAPGACARVVAGSSESVPDAERGATVDRSGGCSVDEERRVRGDGCRFEDVLQLCSHWAQLGTEERAAARLTFKALHRALAHTGDARLADEEWTGQLCAKIEANCFGLFTEPPNKRLAGRAIYPTSALFNHACDPTCERRCDGADAEIVALRAIPAGEEATISYLPPGMPFAERREKLQRDYCFLCRCSLCAHDEQQPTTKRKGGPKRR